jgi:hypothetical protein
MCCESSSTPHFENIPHPWALPIINHKINYIMNQTYIDNEAYEWKGFYA